MSKLSTKENKIYNFISLSSIIFHVLGVIWVLYQILYDIESWFYYMNSTRYYFGLNKHIHNESVIYKSWITAIQIRYIISDCLALWSSLKSKKLLRYTIKMHLIEGFICSVVFYCHNDGIAFCYICMLWTLMWLSSYIFIHLQ